VAYEWPGNIRELENFMELIINTESMPRLLEREEVDGGYGRSRFISVNQANGSYEPLTLLEVQKRHIQRTIIHYKGNISLTLF